MEMNFNLSDYKLHNNYNKLVTVQMLGKLNDMYQDRHIDLVVAGNVSEYSTYIVCRVLDISEGIKNVSVGDLVMTKMVYIASIKDLFEGYGDIDENILIVPERFIDGVITE